MIKKGILVSLLAIALSVSGTQAFAKGKKGGGLFSRSSSQSSTKPADNNTPDNKLGGLTSSNNASPSVSAPNTTSTGAAPASAAAAPASSGPGMGTAIAAGIGGAVVGGLAGAAIASSFSGDDATPSPLLQMTPEDAIKSATEMQAKATEAGFAFAKSDEMLKKATELMTKDDEGKKQAHEIAVIVHTWAEVGVKQADELKKVADKLGL